jgi:TPR repeat protein
VKLSIKVIITIAALVLSPLARAQSATTSNAANLEQTTKLAGQGDASAQYDLGSIYYFGKGVPRDAKVAIEWFSKAAAQGHAGAQFYLGAITYNGQYVPRDYEKAFDFFSMAAAQGNRNAKTNLGVMYKNGEGVPKDLKKAFDVFIETAELGDKTAQIYLAGMYFFGEGTPVDYVLAYMWATISDQIDLKNLKGNYAAASVSRAAPIAKTMSSDQLARGKQLVGEWLSQHPNSPDSGFR